MEILEDGTIISRVFDLVSGNQLRTVIVKELDDNGQALFMMETHPQPIDN